MVHFRKKININFPRLIFSSLEKAEVLIFDNISGRDASIILFADKKFTFLDTRRQTLNIKAFLSAVFSRGIERLSLKYYNHCIKQVEPKICFIMQENTRVFYDLKILNPKIIFIAVSQGGNYGDPYADQWPIFYERGEKLNTDYLVVDSENSVDFFSKVIHAKFLRYGNSRVNANLPFIDSRKVTGVGYISEFRSGSLNYNKAHSKLIGLISKYTQLNGLDFKVGLSSSRPDKTFSYLEELNFFKLHAGAFNSSPLPSIVYLSGCEIVICCISTLGLELISLGKKVIFIDILYKYENYRKNYFSHRYGDSGPFWCSGNSSKEILDKISYVKQLSQDEWRNILSKYEMPIQYFDPENRNFKNFLNRLI